VETPIAAAKIGRKNENAKEIWEKMQISPQMRHNEAQK